MHDELRKRNKVETHLWMCFQCAVPTKKPSYALDGQHGNTCPPVDIGKKENSPVREGDRDVKRIRIRT